jgi:GntR family transcriptional repressor for pyruvate dehydrogenase complex
MATPAFRPAKPVRAFDGIIAQIREMLRAGELYPGDRLPSERELAEQFAVSRNTVREAMRMLEITGLVELRRGAAGGAFIAKPDPSKVATSMTDMIELSLFTLEDLIEARRWIEDIVIRAVCERATEETFERLEANMKETERLEAAGDWRAKVAANVEFHSILAAETGNPVVVAMMKPLMEVVLKVVLAVGPADNDPVLASRRRFMEHLRRRDAAAAVAEMDRHLQWIHSLTTARTRSGAGTSEVSDSRG